MSLKKRFLTAIALGWLAMGTWLHAAESIDDSLKRAALEYGQRLRQANDELIQSRDRIAKEKAPSLQAMRLAEDRIIAAQEEITRLETVQEQFQENRRKLSKDGDGMRKNESYLNTLAHDSLNAFEAGFLPGEKQLLADKLGALKGAFGEPSKLVGAESAVDVTNVLLEQVKRSLGGYTAEGESLIEGDNKMVGGTFAFIGPETFFRASQSSTAGTVRMREGSDRGVTYLLPEWKPAAVDAFFRKQESSVIVDASAGKALRLRETKGTVWQHIHQGGLVSYAILAVGALALILIVQKFHDLSQMAVDDPRVVQKYLDAFSAGKGQEGDKLNAALKRSTAELFSVGLRYQDESRDLLEERLMAVLLRQRLHYERRLPLLAVIATAAPLMGLLGTVTGMVKTFTLITVFGTGNAGKLASGISEVLVATELGLLVAIPTLVAHGFLSQRIQKNLSLLERYALEFVTTILSERAAAQKESIPSPI